MERRARIQIYLPESWMKKIEQISKETGLSYSDIGKIAIKKFLDDPKLA